MQLQKFPKLFLPLSFAWLFHFLTPVRKQFSSFCYALNLKWSRLNVLTYSAAIDLLLSLYTFIFAVLVKGYPKTPIFFFNFLFFSPHSPKGNLSEKIRTKRQGK